ncbi:hypothetical protein XMD509_002402 [Marinobacterium sp. xm-d-509]|jgi:hypothetical protein|nr:hypothetical protein [Marinobacterium sp. xm-d-509]
MCSGPSYTPPPPPPMAPPVLEQLAPKSASSGESSQTKRRKGLSRYRIDPAQAKPKTTTLGGIPTKTGAGT